MGAEQAELADLAWPGQEPTLEDLLRGQNAGTLVARVRDGVTTARVGGRALGSSSSVPASDVAVLGALAADRRPHGRRVAGHDYRVLARKMGDGDVVRPVAGQAGGPGGFSGTRTSSAVTGLRRATTTRWAAASTGSMSVAPLELASGKAVMSIGGFNGGDASPTLDQFRADVASGQNSYFVTAGQGGGPGGNNGTGAAITSWVAAHHAATTVGGSTVYDLRGATTS